MAHRILGITSGGVDSVTDEIMFDLRIDGQPPMSFIAEYAAASQFIGALGRMFVELRRILLEKKELTTPAGIPYTFRIDPKFAVEIADQLRTESAKPHQTGRA